MILMLRKKKDRYLEFTILSTENRKELFDSKTPKNVVYVTGYCDKIDNPRRIRTLVVLKENYKRQLKTN